MKRLFGVLLIITLLCRCSQTEKTQDMEILFQSNFEKENVITLSDDEIKLNNQIVTEQGDVFISHDIIYYEDKDTYESGYDYGEGEVTDKHSADEAKKHTVLNITKSGAYRISGELSMGQIRIDLGENAKNDSGAIVELILDNANVTCTVAPAILFMNVYECDGNTELEDATSDIDTSKAGAVLVLAEDSTSNINGSYVAKIFKDGEDEKKLYEQDGAIYSYMSMNVFGKGTLNLTAQNEGLDTERHLTVNGGNINIYSQNDGINTNEDNVSVTTINGGNIYIAAGLGQEGDGIDSNGWLVINGGTVVSIANPAADAGLDSDLGSFINGGTVIALGSTMDWPESDSDQVTVNLQFSRSYDCASSLVVKDKNDKVVFAYKPSQDNQILDRIFRGAVISSPNFEVDGEYTIYTGSTFIGEEKNGIYLLDSLTLYEDGEVLGYTSNDFGMGMRPGGFGHMPQGQKPQMPDGEKDEIPDDFKDRMHNGENREFSEGEIPKMPYVENSQLPDDLVKDRTPDGKNRQFPDGERSQMNDNNINDVEIQTVFKLTDKVNLFSGVTTKKRQ